MNSKPVRIHILKDTLDVKDMVGYAFSLYSSIVESDHTGEKSAQRDRWHTILHTEAPAQLAMQTSSLQAEDRPNDMYEKA